MVFVCTKGASHSDFSYWIAECRSKGSANMYDIAKLDTEHNLFLRICALVCTCVTRNCCTISFLIDNKMLPQYVPDLLYLLRNDTPGASDKKKHRFILATDRNRKPYLTYWRWTLIYNCIIFVHRRGWMFLNWRIDIPSIFFFVCEKYLLMHSVSA